MSAFHKVTWVFILVAMLPTAYAQTSSRLELKPFTSDGCSLFPDENIINHTNWCACCFAHDIAYWQGGTEAQREQADIALRDCVQQATGDKTLAKLMYEGVRFGGSPYFYNWYRWGYGWPYTRKYQVLTDEETAAVAARLDEYLVHPENAFCGNEVWLPDIKD